MANLKQIYNKIKSVSNLSKITKALEVVSTIKLQKTKEKADALKNYLLDLMMILNCVWDKFDLFKVKDVHSTRTLNIIITTDRWQCGSINAKILRFISEENKDKKETTDFYVIGKKGLSYIDRAGYNIVGTLSVKDDFADEDLLPVYDFLKIALEQKQYKEIKIYFNYFKNSLTQIPTSLQIFPLSMDTFQNFIWEIGVDYKCTVNVGKKDLIIEPNQREFMKEIYRQIRSYMITSALIQNKTGEHAARMIAMKNAKDNSKAIIHSLTLSFNKARQAAVTQEISEIVSAKIALED